MAFAIKKRDSYRWTVEHIIGKTDGKPDVMRFDVEFKAVSRTEYQALAARLTGPSKMSDEQFTDEVLRGWHGLDGEDGAEFAFDKTNVAKLLELYPGIAGSIMSGFMDSVSGGFAGALLSQAARKN